MSEKNRKSLKFHENAKTTDDRSKGIRRNTSVARLLVGDEDFKRDLFSTIAPRRSRYSIAARAPVVKFQPTYRMDSKNPFDTYKVHEIMTRVVSNNIFPQTKFDNRQAEKLCHGLKEEILSQVKQQNYDRYKIIVMISLGEKFHQSFRSSTKCLWDAEKDAIVVYNHDTPNIFVIATVFGIYYD